MNKQCFNYLFLFTAILVSPLLNMSAYAASNQSDVSGLIKGTDRMSANSEWKYTEPLPFPRYSYATFKKNGFLYVLGGYTTGGFGIKQVIRAEMKPDGSLGSWVQLDDFPVSIGREAATNTGDHVYVSGGTESYYNPEMYSVYKAKINKDGSLDTWTLETAQLVKSRQDHSMVYLKGYVYAIGGGSQGSRLSSVEYAQVNSDGSLSAWKTTQSLNRTRWLNSSIAVGNNIYCTGNLITEYATMGENGEILSWTDSGGNMPTCMGHPFFSSINTTLYVYGGWDEWEHVGKDMMQTYINPDGSLQNWTLCSYQLNELRTGIPAAPYNNTLYAVAGDENVNGYSMSSTVEYLNLNTLNRAITFSSATDTSRFVYELPPDNKCTTLATISWVSTFDGNDGILKATFTKPNQGVKMTLQIPEWFSSDSGKWYQLSINYRASSKSSTNNFQTILHTYEGILPSPTTLSGNGLLSCPTTWFTLRNYIHANGSQYGMFPQIVFKNYGSESVTVYIDSIQVWEVIAPLMNYNNFTAGSFDQSSDTTFWQYELPSDVADDLSVFGIDSGKFFVDFSGATTEGLKMTMATAPGSVISYSSDMDYFSGQNFQYEYTGTKGTKDSMVLVCMYSYDSAYDDPEEISAIARINSLNEVDAGYLETIFQPRESSVYSQIIIKNESQGTLWIDEAYPLLDFNKVD